MNTTCKKSELMLMRRATASV